MQLKELVGTGLAAEATILVTRQVQAMIQVGHLLVQAGHQGLQALVRALLVLLVDQATTHQAQAQALQALTTIHLAQAHVDHVTAQDVLNKHTLEQGVFDKKSAFLYS